MKYANPMSFLFSGHQRTKPSEAKEEPIEDCMLASPLASPLVGSQFADTLQAGAGGVAGLHAEDTSPRPEGIKELEAVTMPEQDHSPAIKPAEKCRRIVHMHIPKTAGTALRTALGQVTGPQLRIFPHYDERQFTTAEPAEWDVFSGHFGYKTAQHLNGDIVTILRNPIDRFVSVYYFWRELLERKIEVNRKTRLTKLYSLDEFVFLHDELALIEEFFNRMTWQIAYGSSIEHRKELRDQGKTENDVLKQAIANLGTFAVVGTQSRLPDFNGAMNARYGINLDVQKINVTENRPTVSDLSIVTRRRIADWVYLDLELYESASRQAHLPE